MASRRYEFAVTDVPQKGRLIPEKDLNKMSKHLKIKKDVPAIEQVSELIYILLQSDQEKKEYKNFKIGP